MNDCGHKKVQKDGRARRKAKVGCYCDRCAAIRERKARTKRERLAKQPQGTRTGKKPRAYDEVPNHVRQQDAKERTAHVANQLALGHVMSSAAWRNKSLMVVDLHHFFGFSWFGHEEWTMRFRPDLSEVSARRAWDHMLSDLRTYGFSYETDEILSSKLDRFGRIRLRPEALQLALGILPPISEEED